MPVMHLLSPLRTVLLISFSTVAQPTGFVNASLSERNQLVVSQITFGVFCGECGKTCATMYKYNMTGDTKAILVDTEDSYFKNNGIITFNKKINNTSEINDVRNLIQNIPSRLLVAQKGQTFGCPDCDDGCGIYFELQQGTLVKKFYIDRYDKGMSKDVLDFAAAIEQTVTILHTKN